MWSKEKIQSELLSVISESQGTYPKKELRQKLINKTEILFNVLDNDLPEQYEELIERIVTGSFWAEKDFMYLKELHPQADALYKDTIVKAVGLREFEDLKCFGFIEACGSIGGRKLYAV